MNTLLDLKGTCGLDLKLDTKSFRLIFGKGLTAPSRAIRNIREMQEVLLAPGINQPEELYYMYRDVHLLKDAQLLKKSNLRYDVTVIKPDRLGKELMKTAGHYHPGGFGELYEVVQGKAFCMLQKANPDDYRIIEDVILVQARAGQKIVIPPGYGHILINPGPGCLVTSNWVSSGFSSEYELYKKAGGAAYFLVVDTSTPLSINPERSRRVDTSTPLSIPSTGSGSRATSRDNPERSRRVDTSTPLSINPERSRRVDAQEKLECIKNPFFKQVSPVRFALPAEELARFGLKENNPIYPIISKETKKLEFLNYPERYDYSDIFKISQNQQIILTL